VTGLSHAPERTYRLIPSRFQPIDAFETVMGPRDLERVLDLEGWTNDRLVAPRLRRLPTSEWVYGRADASLVMAAFLHGAPQRIRFAGPKLGAWYSASALETSVLEIVGGIRREIALEQKREELREYIAPLEGTFVEMRGTRPDLQDPDATNYPVSQIFGRSVRAGPHDGIAYDSVRHAGGVTWVSYRPTRIHDVLQARHIRLVVSRSGKVVVDEMHTGT
jgi:hypothetical protein